MIKRGSALVIPGIHIGNVFKQKPSHINLPVLRGYKYWSPAVDIAGVDVGLVLE